MSAPLITPRLYNESDRYIYKMSAKDLFHNAVKTALQKEGWLITHDPMLGRVCKLAKMEINREKERIEKTVSR